MSVCVTRVFPSFRLCVCMCVCVCVCVCLCVCVTARYLLQISELGNKQTTTLVFENKEFNLKTQTQLRVED